jgi:hypothetical protein
MITKCVHKRNAQRGKWQGGGTHTTDVNTACAPQQEHVHGDDNTHKQPQAIQFNPRKVVHCISLRMMGSSFFCKWLSLVVDGAVTPSCRNHHWQLHPCCSWIPTGAAFCAGTRDWRCQE